MGNHVIDVTTETDMSRTALKVRAVRAERPPKPAGNSQDAMSGGSWPLTCSAARRSSFVMLG
jgi:hypothetical protein